jgi:hypothetical protein
MATVEYGSAAPITWISIGMALRTTGAVVTGTAALPPPPAPFVALDAVPLAVHADVAARRSAAKTIRTNVMKGSRES